jgi:cyclopropane-fatty-acyl-phospholipid synthase
LVTVELKDYRDPEGIEVYDKVASVGMFEHVGIKHLPSYFSIVHRLLKPNGLYLNHGITHARAEWDKTVSTEFINKYVFPDGQLDRISNIQRSMEDAPVRDRRCRSAGCPLCKDFANLGFAARAP